MECKKFSVPENNNVGCETASCPNTRPSTTVRQLLRTASVTMGTFRRTNSTVGGMSIDKTVRLSLIYIPNSYLKQMAIYWPLCIYPEYCQDDSFHYPKYLTKSLYLQVRATLMVFMLVLTNISCIFPIFVFSLLMYWNPSLYKPQGYAISMFLFFLNSALNPIMYGLFNTNFRGTFNRY
eukprot:sb/3471753/